MGEARDLIFAMLDAVAVGDSAAIQRADKRLKGKVVPQERTAYVYQWIAKNADKHPDMCRRLREEQLARKEEAERERANQPRVPARPFGNMKYID